MCVQEIVTKFAEILLQNAWCDKLRRSFVTKCALPQNAQKFCHEMRSCYKMHLLRRALTDPNHKTSKPKRKVVCCEWVNWADCVICYWKSGLIPSDAWVIILYIYPACSNTTLYVWYVLCNMKNIYIHPVMESYQITDPVVAHIRC